MLVVLGLIILVAAVVVGVAGVFNNVGSGHALTHDFSVFGYHITGSTGASSRPSPSMAAAPTTMP